MSDGKPSRRFSRRYLWLAAAALFGALISGINWWSPLQDSDPDRGAKPLPSVDALGDRFDRVIYLQQGWSPADSLWFYNTTQGSDLLPYDFFLFLEQPGSQDLVRSDANMNHFRYLPQKATRSDPDGLPIGFVKDHYKGHDYVGFTCAACHTAQINYGGTAIRIDGGPAAADMDGFLSQLVAALQQTLDDPVVQARFMHAVLGQGHYKSEGAVKDDLTLYAQQMNRYQFINQSPIAYGYARLDAFGRIYNRVLEHIVDRKRFNETYDGILGPQTSTDFTFEQKVSRLLLSKEAAAVVPRGVNDTLNATERRDAFQALQSKAGRSIEQREALRDRLFNRPDAPVSYPFLWDVPQHDYVQWNGLTSNAGLGPLGRNAGEVVGVFGTLDWTKEPGFSLSSLIDGQGFSDTHISFESSINARNLRLVEERLRSLYSPQWPDVLGAINAVQSSRGKVLFDQFCVGCHANIARDDPERRIVASLTRVEAVGTDDKMAMNSAGATGYSGILRNLYAPAGSVGSILLDERAPVASLLTKSVEGVVATPYPYDRGLLWPIKRARDWVTNLASAYFGNVIQLSLKHGNFVPDTDADPFASLKVYKARALNGIWATAPYLHNGSVPTLYDLLLPPASRPQTFLVGSREFDPKKVGFRSEGYEGGFRFDTRLPGNRNSGHDYGTGQLSEDDRLALVEYLKSL